MAKIIRAAGNPQWGNEMKTIVLICVAALVAAPLYAGTIENACNETPRGATAATCLCIQQVADVQLSSGDQKQAAKFFQNPQLAQDTRQSDNAAKERFWLRYKAFGLSAAIRCNAS